MSFCCLAALHLTTLNVLASRLGLPARTVADVYEPFLLRQALICKDDAGRRQLTADGRLHLSHYRNDPD